MTLTTQLTKRPTSKSANTTEGSSSGTLRRDDRTTIERRSNERSNESGYVIAQTALLIVPLLIFAAFATDIGSWYVQSQKIQRGADAAALAGVAMMPNLVEAEQLARETARLNGYTDATPGNNNDFDTGPLPQIRVTAPTSSSLQVEIRTSEDVFFAKLVTDDIEIERRSFSEFVKPVHLGNPTSGLGTGVIPQSELGQPNDQMWLAINGYCKDREHGDHFLSGFYDGPSSPLVQPNFNNGKACGGTFDATGSLALPGVTTPSALPNPTFDSDAYVFVAEYAPGSPNIDLAVYDPGADCPGALTPEQWLLPTGGSNPLQPDESPLHVRLYGPSQDNDHRGFIAANAPISEGFIPLNTCPADGWFGIPGGQNLSTPGANGGFYYLQVSNRNPTNDPTGQYWGDSGLNLFSLRATRAGSTLLCTFSTLDPTCPQLYALDNLPLFRNIGGESDFFLTRIDDTHAGDTLIVTFFDAAEGVQNLQFVNDADGEAAPFEWKYADNSVGQTPTGTFYSETTFSPHSSTCSWTNDAGVTIGSNPCLDTTNRADFNDRWIQISIDIPDSYTCTTDCWWRVRYTTAATATDRSGWAIHLLGDPIRIIE